MMLATLFYQSLDGLRICRAARRLRRGATILCYHNVVPDDLAVGVPAAALHMPVSRFEAQVCWLRQHYELVCLHELVERLERGVGLAHVAALTFDDGYAGTFRHAVPLLLRLGIPATIFVVAEAPGRWDGFWWDGSELSPPQPPLLPPPASPLPPDLCPADWPLIVRAASEGIVIGAHSATHTSLPHLSDGDLLRELKTSRDIIQRETGVWPDLFSYPYGLWDQRVKAAVRSAGYRAGLTIDRGLNSARADRWALRRIPVPAAIEPAAFHAYATGLNPRWAWR